MYDDCIKAIENDLCRKLLSSASLPMKVRYALRSLLRKIRIKRGMVYYRIVEKSFFWINGQYAYGLINSKELKVLRTLRSFYRFFRAFPLMGIDLIDMPDHYIHAEVLLEMYELSGNKKYLPLIHQAANNLKSEVQKNGDILRYGNGKKAYIDTLGMITEFCYNYDSIFSGHELSKIAEDQMDYFISAAKEEEVVFPFHSYEIESNALKHEGSNSWGRGIGWYLLGLGVCAKNNAAKYSRCYIESIMNTFLKQSEDGFLYEDMKNCDRIDTSTTSMAALALYMGLKNGMFHDGDRDTCLSYLNKAVGALIKATTEDGRVLYCTGECGGADYYSREYGDYYAQGYTLRLLNQLNNDGVML